MTRVNPKAAGLLWLTLVLSLSLSTIVAKDALGQDVTLSASKLRRAVGSPTARWVCPKKGATLRFHLEKGAKRHLTSHEGGECVPVINKGAAGYKLWIESSDAIISAYVRVEELDFVVQSRVRLAASPVRASRQRGPGVYLEAGTPVEVREDQGKSVYVMLPKADILASGWLPKSKLKITSRRRKARQVSKGEAIWIPGKSELLGSPDDKSLARIARREKVVAANVVKRKDGFVLVSYAGRHATAIGWIRISEIQERNTPSSNTAIGMAKIEDSEYWAEAGEAVYDRPYGEKVGVFRQDAELVGARLKNGWVHFPLATEFGTFNLWSPLY